MATGVDYNYSDWGTWDLTQRPEMFNYLRSILKPKYLLWLDGGQPSGLSVAEKRLLDGLKKDILRADIPVTNLFRNMIKTGGGEKVDDKIRQLESLRASEIISYSRQYLIGNDLMAALRQALPAKFVLYLDGGMPSGLSDEERRVLDQFLANPGDWEQSAFEMRKLISPSDTPTFDNWVAFSDAWNTKFGSPAPMLQPTVPAATTTTTPTTGPAATTTTTPTTGPGQTTPTVTTPTDPAATAPATPDLTNIPGVDTFDPTQGVSQEQAAAGLLPGVSYRPATGGDGVTGGGGDGVTGGGDGVTGGGGVITTPSTTGVEGIPDTWQQAAAELYADYYAIVQNIPELAALLKQAYEEDWEPNGAKFQAALEATNWWKTTTATAREWDINSSRDPATYDTLVKNTAGDIKQQALGLGIRLSEETAINLATRSLREGWSPQMVTDSIGMSALTKGTTGMTQLTEGFYGQSVRQIAQRYGVTLADETFRSFVNRIAVGDESFDSFQDYVLTMAKTLYPALGQQFDAGKTFEDITAGYRQIAADTLEVDPNSIDFMNPLWATAVTYQPDPTTGEQRMMNVTEWGNYLRNTSAFGYEYTDQAKSRAYDVVDRLADMFGKV